MAERTNERLTRPRPGPRPSPAAHGTTRRRVGAPRVKRQPPAARQPERPQPAARPPMTRRTKIRIATFVLLVSAAGFIIALLEAPLFEVQEVQISGAARTSEGAILEMLALPDGQALLTYDINEAQRSLGELPWVESVDLARQWPSTLRVVVRERSISAGVARPSGSEWIVVAGDGVVVESRLSPPSGVPLIVATEEVVDSAVIGQRITGVDRVLEISGALPLQLAPWVTTWTSDSDGVVTAELVGSAKVNFGSRDDHRSQFVSLASILNGGAELVCLEIIDLTIADTPVLHRDPACIAVSRELG